jgi:hypothetical protein
MITFFAAVGAVCCVGLTVAALIFAAGFFLSEWRRAYWAVEMRKADLARKPQEQSPEFIRDMIALKATCRCDACQKKPTA